MFALSIFQIYEGVDIRGTELYSATTRPGNFMSQQLYISYTAKDTTGSKGFKGRFSKGSEQFGIIQYVVLERGGVKGWVPRFSQT